MEVKGKKIWIVGAAKSGVAAAQLLHAQGARLFVTDAAEIESSSKAVLNGLGIEFEEGGHSIEKLLSDADFVVLSPSIPLDKPLPMSARQAGIPMVSEIEVASWFLPESSFVVGITGTNGKSTTTHYAAQLLTLGQLTAVPCGNYGRAFCDTLLDPAKFNAYAVEVSSYQLETTLTFRPNVSVFLNLQNDHLARYGTLDEYLKAKWRLVLLTQRSGLAVVDNNVFLHALRLGLALPECPVVISYGFLSKSEATVVMDTHKAVVTKRKSLGLCSDQSLPQASYGALASLALPVLSEHKMAHVWCTRGDDDEGSFEVHILSGEGVLKDITFNINEPVLPGDHNQLNILAASLAALHLGMHPNIIRAQWQSKTSVYRHLAHRLEDVAKHQTLRASSGRSVHARIVNDSKATNVESMLVAVRSFPQGLRLLLGGEPKGDSYAVLAPFIGSNVIKVYPFGKAAPLICQQLAGLGDAIAKPSRSMLDAAQLALDECSDGDVVLLSPACASFDEFKNFEHRGDSFRNWALQRVINI
ncbi:MAG: UDP-N-acetylmuramoyl-L-alanine--D-glutamate ligase [Betaproteobacteria bacterium]|nr:UDP-N-acetylmuramoyl-L-alanine--D-glutamate ligase [Betaproteobacteria bacterium]